MFLRTLLLLAMVLGLLVAGLGQGRFDHYGQAEGLSTTSIRCLTVSQDGFVWIGTDDGLFRFDGYQFKAFRPDPSQPGSISSSNIYCLLEDSAGYLWVGTLRGGLNRYDPRSGQFAVFQHVPGDSSKLHSDEVTSLYLDARQQLWVGTQQGLHRWRGDSSFQHYDLLAYSPDRRRTTVFALGGDRLGGIWAGMGPGFFRLDPATGRVRYVSSLDLPQLPGEGVPTTIALAPDSSLLVGVRGSGLFRLRIRPVSPDSLDLAFEAFPIATATQPGLSTAAVERVLPTPDGSIWVATRRGLNHIQAQPAGGYRYRDYQPDPEDPHSLSYFEVCALGRDLAGNLWVGTADGLNLLPAHQPAFHLLPHRVDDPTALASPYVISVMAPPDGRVWVALPTGIQIWDPATGQVQTGYMGDRRMVQVFQDQEGGYWASRYGGLMRLDAQGQAVETYTYTPGYSFPFGTQLLMDSRAGGDGRLWLTSFRGLLAFEPASAQFTPYRYARDNHFTQFVETDSGLLVGGQLGLQRLDLAQDSFYQVAVPGPEDVLAGKVVKSLLRARDGTLYIGAREGLYRWHPAQGIWHHYREPADLANGIINCILEDERGRIWFSTNQGISCLEPATGRLRHFDPADGLPQVQFRNRSGCTGPGGWLYFGSQAGLVYFHPDSLRPNPYRPPVRLTSFRLFNREVPVGASPEDGTFALPAQIGRLDQLSLRHDQRLFSLGFAALNYRHPEENQYAYRLQGFDTAWVYTQASERLATYTNLAPGHYTFEVKAANDDGLWGEVPTRLAIEIRPPWWRTWWAYLLYVLLIAGAAYALLRLRITAVRREEQTRARIEQAKVEEREQVRARSSRDFHDEAGNRITKISLYTGLLKQQAAGQPALVEMLDKVEANARDLASGMRDFIWVLDPRFDSLEGLSHRIRDFGQQLYDDTGISFRYEAGLPKAALTLDVNAKRHLLMIAKEAMHNALKYAQAHTVWVRFGVAEGMLYLDIQDDGLGFDPGQGGQGHGLRNMETRAREIGATWTLEAVPGMGTHIRLSREV